MPGRVIAALIAAAALAGLVAVWTAGGPAGDPLAGAASTATTVPTSGVPPPPLAPASASAPPTGSPASVPTPTSTVVPPVGAKPVRLGDPIRGQVRDGAGAPVAGAEVLVQVAGQQLGVVTGPDGAFELRAPAAGDARLTVRAPGRAPVQRPVGPGEDLRFALAAEAQVAGRVEDAGGTGVPGAFVRAESYDDPSLSPAIVQSGTEGRFVVPGLAAGARYRFRATHPQHASGAPIELTAPAVDVVLALLPGATLRVRVRGVDGAPLPELPRPDAAQPPGFLALRAYAVLSGAGTSRTFSNWTDADRTELRIEGLAAGTYTLAAAVRGHGKGATGEVVVPASGEVEATLQLAGGGFVRVRVLDGSGAPVAGAEVQPTADFGTGWAYLLAGRTGDDGTVRAGPFPPGPAHLKVRLDGPWIEATATVTAGSEVDLDVRLAPAGG